MRNIPIIFSSASNRKIRVGMKTQTRRMLPPHHPKFPEHHIVNPDAIELPYIWYWNGKNDRVGASHRLRWQAGDRLWVKEAFAFTGACADIKLADYNDPASIIDDNRIYRADADGYDEAMQAWRSPLFMPRWMSRTTLIVTDVRVQRLQDISEADALAEGIVRIQHPERGEWGWPQRKYAELWDTINGHGAWDANPWVIALTFDVHHANIDALELAA